MINFEYKIVRSRRKTLSITVYNDGRVIIKAPLRKSDKEILQFINSKADWVERRLQINKNNNTAICGVAEGNAVLVKGVPVKLTVGANKNVINNDCVDVKSIKDLKKLYIKNFADEFSKLFNEICAGSGLSCSGISFKSYKSRWGCCDRNKKIIFNYKLLMLSERLWAAVISHELCHTVYMNHSKQFYGLLESVLPEYRLLKKELKKYSLVCSMY